MTNQELKPAYIAIAILSVIAILPIPYYGYYTFLRIVVCLGAAVTAYLKRDNKNKFFWLCLLVAIIFNPIVIIALPKEIWIIFNILAAGLFSCLAYQSSKAA